MHCWQGESVPASEQIHELNTHARTQKHSHIANKHLFFFLLLLDSKEIKDRACESKSRLLSVPMREKGACGANVKCVQIEFVRNRRARKVCPLQLCPMQMKIPTFARSLKGKADRQQ